MNQIELDACNLQLRESEADLFTVATVEGIAVPYDTPTKVGGVTESFARDAFDPQQVKGAPLCWRHDEPVGVITEARNDADGLHISAQIADTQQGRDAAALLRVGGVRGLSVGFTPLQDAWTRSKDAVTRVKAHLGELSLTHQPAYSTAAVSNIREENTMPEQATDNAPEQAPEQEQRELSQDFVTREEYEALRERVASVNVVTTKHHTIEPTADDFMRTYSERLLTRAWTDVTLDGTPSDTSPVPDAVSARINLARPTFTAIGAQPLANEGMESVWVLDGTDPVTGVQSAEKTEIASGPAAGVLVKSDVVTIAGGNDLSIQFIQRAKGWTLTDYMQRLGEQYARNTNADLLTELGVGVTAEQNLGTASLTPAKIGESLGAAAATIAGAVGTAPSVVVLNPSKFFEIAAVSGNGYPIAGGNVGNADLASLSYSAFGLRFICDPQLGATVGYVMDTRCVGLRESAGAPYSMSVAVPSKLGQDIAVFGYLAIKVLRPGGLVRLTAA